MSRSANYVRPVRLSLEVLRDASIGSFPVSLKQILRHYGIRLRSYSDHCADNECDMQTCISTFGKDGATIEHNGKYVIVYNDRQPIKNRIRFTIAHELGHIFHKHHEELGVNILQRLWVEKSLYDVLEDEANCFARNLLCPAISVQTMFRAHGFVLSEYDREQNRTVWWKVAKAPCLPDLPSNLTDHFLVKQSFLVTETAAKTRCHFLREDLRNSDMTLAETVLGTIVFTTQWRCRKCGALRLPGKAYCYHCGAKERFSFVSMKTPSHRPVDHPYGGLRYASCPVCGNDGLSAGTDYCPICGNAAANPCIPWRVKNHSLAHLMDLAENGVVHLNPPGARHCLTCGAPTLYGITIIDKPIPLYDYLKHFGLKPDTQGGLLPVKYGPNIPCDYNDYYGVFRVKKCPVCLNEDNDTDAEYCIMCGTNLTNLCEGRVDEDDEFRRHSNPANARFCRCCGKPTAYSKLTILPDYRTALRRIAEKAELQRELAEMDIDEDLFWKMQNDGEESDDQSDKNTQPGQSDIQDWFSPSSDGDDVPF